MSSSRSTACMRDRSAARSCVPGNGGLISFPSDSSRGVVTALSGDHADDPPAVSGSGSSDTTAPAKPRCCVWAGVYEPVRGTMERAGKTSALFDLSPRFRSALHRDGEHPDPRVVSRPRSPTHCWHAARRSPNSPRLGLYIHPAGPCLLRRHADATGLLDLHIDFARHPVDGRVADGRATSTSPGEGPEAARRARRRNRHSGHRHAFLRHSRLGAQPPRAGSSSGRIRADGPIEEGGVPVLGPPPGAGPCSTRWFTQSNRRGLKTCRQRCSTRRYSSSPSCRSRCSPTTPSTGSTSGARRQRGSCSPRLCSTPGSACATWACSPR